MIDPKIYIEKIKIAIAESKKTNNPSILIITLLETTDGIENIEILSPIITETYFNSLHSSRFEYIYYSKEEIIKTLMLGNIIKDLNELKIDQSYYRINTNNPYKLPTETIINNQKKLIEYYSLWIMYEKKPTIDNYIEKFIKNELIDQKVKTFILSFIENKQQNNFPQTKSKI